MSPWNLERAPLVEGNDTNGHLCEGVALYSLFADENDHSLGYWDYMMSPWNLEWAPLVVEAAPWESPAGLSPRWTLPRMILFGDS